MLPDYLIIGAQRCGTTSMMNYIADHPGVGRVPRKEVHFFDWNYDKGFPWYEAHFGKKDKLHGEKSPCYLPHRDAPIRIANDLPNAKFIVLLRNPIDRALSQHRFRKNMFRERRKFDDVIFAPPQRFNDGIYTETTNGLLYRGHYAEQLERWFDLFPREQFLIIRSEDFFADQIGILRQVWNFLELTQVVPSKHYQLGSLRSTGSMSDETKQKLVTYFEPHNDRLETLLGRKMGW